MAQSGRDMKTSGVRSFWSCWSATCQGPWMASQGSWNWEVKATSRDVVSLLFAREDLAEQEAGLR